MLATGGSARKAIEVMISRGVKEEKIIFLNLVGCPEGCEALNKSYPKITCVLGEIDECLNEKSYIMPGLGDFGDRYCGTK